MSNYFSVVFSGDFAPVGRYEELVLKSKGAVFGGLAKIVRESDLSIINIEAPLTESSQTIEKSGPKLKANPLCVEAIAQAGFSIAGLANNHIMDCGEIGLKNTIEACKGAGLYTCGAGDNISNATAPLYIERKGLTTAIIAIAETEFSIASKTEAGAAPIDILSTTERIIEARSRADLIFIYIHGGNEYWPYPRPGLKEICRYFVRIGADGVFCHHSHVAGAHEVYNGVPIYYGLGNLIFDSTKDRAGWNIGYAVKVTFDLDTQQLIENLPIPYYQSVGNGGVTLLEGDRLDEFNRKFKHLNSVVVEEKLYLKEWNEYVKASGMRMILKAFAPRNFRGMTVMNKLLPFYRLLLPKSQINSKLNAIRCESHRELLITALERQSDDSHTL